MIIAKAATQLLLAVATWAVPVSMHGGQQIEDRVRATVIVSMGKGEPTPFDSEPLKLLKEPSFTLDTNSARTEIPPMNLAIDVKGVRYLLTKRVLESLGLVQVESLEYLVKNFSKDMLAGQEVLPPDLCRRLIEWTGASKEESEALKSRSGKFNQRKCMIVQVQPPQAGAERITVDVNLDRRLPIEDEAIAFGLSENVYLGANRGVAPSALPTPSGPAISSEVRISCVSFSTEPTMATASAGAVLDQVSKVIRERATQLRKDLQKSQQLDTNATTVGALDESLRAPLLKELKNRFPKLTNEQLDAFKIGKPRITLRVDAWFKNSSGMKGKGIIL